MVKIITCFGVIPVYRLFYHGEERPITIIELLQTGWIKVLSNQEAIGIAGQLERSKIYPTIKTTPTGQEYQKQPFRTDTKGIPVWKTVPLKTTNRDVITKDSPIPWWKSPDGRNSRLSPKN